MPYTEEQIKAMRDQYHQYILEAVAIDAPPGWTITKMIKQYGINQAQLSALTGTHSAAVVASKFHLLTDDLTDYGQVRNILG